QLAVLTLMRGVVVDVDLLPRQSRRLAHRTHHPTCLLAQVTVLAHHQVHAYRRCRLFHSSSVTGTAEPRSETGIRAATPAVVQCAPSWLGWTGDIPDRRVLRRGQHDHPGRLVLPPGPGVAPSPDVPPSGYRLLRRA